MRQDSDTSSALPPIVLLVEDDPDTRDLYESALDDSGLWVAVSSSAADALQYAAELHPDSIVMDVGLPTAVDGFGLAQAFRADMRLGETPIVAVTGLQREEVAPGADLFTSVFFKPVRLPELVSRVKSLSAKSAVLRARADRLRARVPHLVAKSTILREQSDRLADQFGAAVSSLPSTEVVRSCPRCCKPLRFSEQRTLAGTTFDYFLACEAGCGLYCYDHSLRKMITLVG